MSKSGRTKFFKQLVLDKSNAEDVQKVVQVVLEEHSDFIVSWATIDAKNTKEAYKFIQDNKLE